MNDNLLVVISFIHNMRGIALPRTPHKSCENMYLLPIKFMDDFMFIYMLADEGVAPYYMDEHPRMYQSTPCTACLTFQKLAGKRGTTSITFESSFSSR